MTRSEYPVGKPRGRLLFIGLPGHTVEYPKYQTASGFKYGNGSLSGYQHPEDRCVEQRVADEAGRSGGNLLPACISRRAKLDCLFGVFKVVSSLCLPLGSGSPRARWG